MAHNVTSWELESRRREKQHRAWMRNACYRIDSAIGMLMDARYQLVDVLGERHEIIGSLDALMDRIEDEYKGK